jgi:hypothetical protein
VVAGGGQVMHVPGQLRGDPHDAAPGSGDDLQVHPVLAVLAGIERPVGGEAVDRDQGAVQDQVRVPRLAAAASARRSLGDRAASKAMVSVTYGQAVAVPMPNPAASSAKVSPLRR